MYPLSELDRVRANRTKSKVEDILGFPQPRNPKVQGVEITTSDDGKPVVAVLVTDVISGPSPSLPREVEGVKVVIEKCGMMEREGHYRTNRQKMILAVRRIANDLAAKFNKRLGLGWPLTFKLTTRYTVAVVGEQGEDGESYRVIVKILAGVGTQSPLIADMTVTQMSTSQQTSNFIKMCEDGLKDYAPAIRADL